MGFINPKALLASLSRTLGRGDSLGAGGVGDVTPDDRRSSSESLGLGPGLCWPAADPRPGF